MTIDEEKRRDSKRDEAYHDELGPLPAELEKELRELERIFTVDTNKLKEIVLHFEEELRQGLSRVSRCLLPSCDSPSGSMHFVFRDLDGLEPEGGNLPMNATWVLGWPTGNECGEYLTLDLGGTKLRICWVTLNERQGDTTVDQDTYQIPEEYKFGEAEPFWSFLAESIEDFLKKRKIQPEEGTVLPLGFTFSYPATQEYIDHGVLQTWTKGFDIKGVEGHDVADQLRQAIVARGLPVQIVALINDTTGAMIASAYNDPKTVIGAIFGTGCNAAYMENCGSIAKLGGLPSDLPMAINCEYGAFDNDHQVLPRTKYDKTIDRESPRPGEQAFEKMSAGMYLGEIFRQVILDLQRRGLIFQGQDNTKLEEPYIIDTAFLSEIEEDFSPKLQKTREDFKKLLNLDLNEADRYFCRRVTELIAVRGARLCCTGVSAICKKKGIISGHIAADGSVAAKHPRFKARWAQALAEVFDWPQDRKEDPIVMTLAADGSGIGAAVISAMTLARIHAGDLTGVRQK